MTVYVLCIIRPDGYLLDSIYSTLEAAEAEKQLAEELNDNNEYGILFKEVHSETI